MNVIEILFGLAMLVALVVVCACVFLGIPAIMICNWVEDAAKRMRRRKMEKQGYVFRTHYEYGWWRGGIEVIDEIIPPNKKEKT